MNGFLGDFSTTQEGETVNYQCNNGFRPTAEMISICTDTGRWIPPPEELDCLFVTGIIKGI